MAGFNGSGLFQRVHNWVTDRNNGVKIRADRVDAEFDGVADGLSNCITRDGQSTVTANIPLSGYKITGLAAPTKDKDAANKEYVSAVTEALSQEVATLSSAAVKKINARAPDADGDILVREVGQAVTTTGIQDWNDVSHLQHGIDSLIMLGSWPNGPGPYIYYHLENKLYSDSGNLTQEATPYNGGAKKWIRTKYLNAWTPWKAVGEGCNAATLGGFTAEQLQSFRVQNHVTAAAIYAASTDIHLAALDTAISCVTNEKVKITSTLNFENERDGVFYLKRNGVEIGSAGAGSHSGLCAVPFDGNNSTTLANVSFAFIDELPVVGLNIYSIHRRGTSASFYLNRTISSAAGNSSNSERATSTIILEK